MRRILSLMNLGLITGSGHWGSRSRGKGSTQYRRASEARTPLVIQSSPTPKGLGFVFLLLHYSSSPPGVTVEDHS